MMHSITNAMAPENSLSKNVMGKHMLKGLEWW